MSRKPTRDGARSRKHAKPPGARPPGAKPPGAKTGGGQPARRGSAPVRRQGLPTREDILAFIRTSQDKVGKREIARAFQVKGEERVALKLLIAEMVEDGLIEGGRKEFRPMGELPPVAALEIVARDDEGDLIAEPLAWDGPERPRILVLEPPAHRLEGEGALGIGDRILARCQRLDEPDIAGFLYEAELLKKLPRDRRRLIGIFRAASRERGGGSIAPVDRKQLRDWPVRPGDEGGAKDGDLVRFEISRERSHTVPQARIVETLGNPHDQRKISLIAIHAHGLPDEFPARVLAEVETLEAPALKGRRDLRALPLVTIDPADARDHDDAVHAEPDTDPRNPGGFRVTVAIADVAHYVTPASKLDREAQARGNSVYFPDRVVPMLPERLSADLCSLRQGEDRPCLAVEMVIGADGRKRSHTFMRAMMRSAAKLAYEEAQAAVDGRPSERTAALVEPILKPLWAAYAVMSKARDERGPLDLDLPERRILLDGEGRVAQVVIPQRLAAHRLIEEMMIQANVAAAETLEARKTPCVYRVHAEPSKEKLSSLRDFLATLDLKFPASGAIRPNHFNALLARARSLPVPDLVNEVVLRSQSQAEYVIENYGHFGLNLSRYAHFTSPIRRYADLVVHRGLIRALKMGEGGLADAEIPGLADVAQAISQAERRAMAAERETVDRLVAAHLADRVGASFMARISGVTRSGLFVRLKDTGADGFCPASSIGGDFYHYVEEAHAMVGGRTGEAFRLGDEVEVRLVEAIPSAGALRFEMLSEGKRGHVSLAKGWRGKRAPRHRPRH